VFKTKAFKAKDLPRPLLFVLEDTSLTVLVVHSNSLQGGPAKLRPTYILPVTFDT